VVNDEQGNAFIKEVLVEPVMFLTQLLHEE